MGRSQTSHERKKLQYLEGMDYRATCKKHRNTDKNIHKLINITTCSPSNSPSLWEKSKDRFSEDVFHLKQRENPDIDLHYVLQIYNETLIVLENKCLSICRRTLLQFELPVPTRKAHKSLDRGLIRKTNYDKNILQHMVELNKPRLTGDQRMKQ
ncbi:hypothetical protein AVEN_157362-1 [Araneus ventricosus]|uniref:Uncharacterized protein n=1 Tax=Araneus ventricosus TaxID=182803 RepID=A0A4Y2X129_ARAVE|nr:hypothetical protein AVEN_247784-1 [Araneus ventricosus]GBO41827.1 hypothetical protein AVEN_157362-1 [Araneus ventricosus]